MTDQRCESGKYKVKRKRQNIDAYVFVHDESLETGQKFTAIRLIDDICHQISAYDCVSKYISNLQQQVCRVDLFSQRCFMSYYILSSLMYIIFSFYQYNKGIFKSIYTDHIV